MAPSIGDPQWSTNQPFVFAVNGSGIAFRGEGAKRSVISLFSAGMKDPNRHWTVIGDGKGYFKIKRGGLFRLGEAGGVKGRSLLTQRTDLFVFEQTGYEEGKVIGRFRPTGLRPKFIEQIEASGIHLPASTFGIGGKRKR